MGHYSKNRKQNKNKKILFQKQKTEQKPEKTNILRIRKNYCAHQHYSKNRKQNKNQKKQTFCASEKTILRISTIPKTENRTKTRKNKHSAHQKKLLCASALFQKQKTEQKPEKTNILRIRKNYFAHQHYSKNRKQNKNQKKQTFCASEKTILRISTIPKTENRTKTRKNKHSAHQKKLFCASALFQ